MVKLFADKVMMLHDESYLSDWSLVSGRVSCSWCGSAVGWTPPLPAPSSPPSPSPVCPSPPTPPRLSYSPPQSEVPTDPNHSQGHLNKHCKLGHKFHQKSCFKIYHPSLTGSLALYRELLLCPMVNTYMQFLIIFWAKSCLLTLKHGSSN